MLSVFRLTAKSQIGMIRLSLNGWNRLTTKLDESFKNVTSTELVYSRTYLNKPLHCLGRPSAFYGQISLILHIPQAYLMANLSYAVPGHNFTCFTAIFMLTSAQDTMQDCVFIRLVVQFCAGNDLPIH